MAIDDVPALLAQLRDSQAAAAIALEFTILTAARTSEVLGTTWSEIDLDNGVWTLPAARMKAGREHRVPLCTQLLELLEDIRPLSQTWVFPSRRGGQLSSIAMAMLLRRLGHDVTVHGFRSSFRD